MSFNPLYFGSFWNTGMLSASANTPTAIAFNTNGTLRGVSIVSNTQITFAYAGTYNLAFSAQLDNTSGGSQTVGIWLRKGGVDVADTATLVTLGNNEKTVAAWNFFIDAGVGNYFELIWATPSVNVVIYAQAARVAPPAAWTMPLVPSIIATVHKVN